MEEAQDKRDFAVVLGGSQGLGLATVRKLLLEDIPVIAIHRDMRKDRRPIDLEFSALGRGKTPFFSLHMDAIQERGRLEILSEIKQILGPESKIRLLVHSIARGNLKPMDPDADIPALSEVDFKITGEAMAHNVYAWVKLIAQEGLFSPDARVIAFTSEGSRRVIHGYGAVAAAKAAMEAIVRQIAVEFAPRGLRANCLQAGVTPTTSMKRIPGSEDILEHTARRNPSGRLTRPEDIADVVYLLSRPEASWINGTIITVDGGESLC